MRSLKYEFGGPPGPTVDLREVRVVVDGQEPGQTFTAPPEARDVAIGDYEEDGQILMVYHRDRKRNGHYLNPFTKRVKLAESLAAPKPGRVLGDDGQPLEDADAATQEPAGAGAAVAASPTDASATAPASDTTAPATTDGNTAPATGDAAAPATGDAAAPT